MIVSRVPVRLSMGGGGTDFKGYYEKYGGFLLAATINKYIFIVVNKRYNKDIRLSYSKTEIVSSLDDIEHNIIRESLKFTGIKDQIEVASIADVPAKCGLGTSSAFCVALLYALYSFKKKSISFKELAESACQIEIDILKAPIGKQDQYATTFGGFNAYWFNKDGSVIIRPLNMTTERLMKLQNNLLLFYLKKNRSASTVLSEQDQKIKKGIKDTVDRLHKIKEIGLQSKRILEKGNIDDFGEILHAHWTIKKGLTSKVSDEWIDEVYSIALHNGATGGKVVGAGGGGFLLTYCPKEKTRLISALKKAGIQPMWFSFEQEGAKLVFSS